MSETTAIEPGGSPSPEAHVASLVDAIARCGPFEAFEMLEAEPDATVLAALDLLNPALADEVLWEFPEARRDIIIAKAPATVREQWLRNHAYPDGSIGKLMEPALAIFRPEQTVRDAIRLLERMVKRAVITYGFVTGPRGQLQGVLVFRDLLFAKQEQPLSEVMVKNPFFLNAQMPVMDAMQEAVKRHFPAYPVCDADGRLMGVVRGQTLFEKHAFELSAQAGSIVGVEKHERASTTVWRSLKMRHPWLQLNLVTAFVAAAVVGLYQDTIDQLVLLAVFLPVLAGQSGNTGSQALAVVLRAITLGEMDAGRSRNAIVKEALLGLYNGVLVGISAGAAMWFYASTQPDAPALKLAMVVMLAMIGSCAISGTAGAAVPLLLRRLGADPATASGIFLTTATDVASMGMFLALATWLVL